MHTFRDERPVPPELDDQLEQRSRGDQASSGWPSAADGFGLTRPTIDAHVSIVARGPALPENGSSDYQVHSATEFVSFTNMRLPLIVGCAHVALSATV